MTMLERAGLQFVAEGAGTFLEATNKARESVASFSETAEKSGGGLGGFGAALGTVAKVAAGVAVAGITALSGAIVGGVEAFTSYATKLRDIHNQTGILPNDAAALNVAFTEVGTSFDKVAMQLDFLGKGLETAKGKLGPTGQELKNLGIDAYETSTKVTTMGTAVTTTGNATASATVKVAGHKMSVAQLTDQYNLAKARLDDMSASWDKHKTHTETATVQYQQLKEKVAALGDAMKGAAGTITTTGGAFSTTTQTLKPSIQLLKEIADKLDTMPEGLEKTTAEMRLFGKSGRDLDEALHAIAGGGLDEAARKAKLFGLTIGEDGVAESVKAEKSFADLSLMGQGLAVTFGSTLMPAILPLIQKIAELAMSAMPAVISAITQVGDALRPIIDTISNFAAAFAAASDKTNYLRQVFIQFVPGGAAVVAVIQSIIGFLSNLVAALLQPSDSVKLLGDTFTTVTGIIQAAFPAILSVIKTVITAVGSVIQAVLPYISAIGTVVQGAVATVQESLPRIQEIFKIAGDFISGVVKAIAAIISAVFGQIAKFLHDHGDQIQGTLRSTWNGILDIVKLTLQILNATIVPALNAIAQFINQHGAQIQALFTATWNIIRDVVTTAINLIRGILQAVLQLIQGDTSGALETLKATFSTVWNAIKQLVSDAIYAVKAVVNLVLAILGTDVDTLWNQIRNTIQNVCNAILKGVTDTFNNVRQSIINAIQSAIDGVGALLGAFYDRGKAIIDSIVNGINAIGGHIRDAVMGFINGAISSAMAAINTALTNIRSAISGAQNAINGLWSSIGDVLRAIGNIHIPNFGGASSNAMGLMSPGAMMLGASSSTSNSYAPSFNLNVNSVLPVSNLVSQFAVLEALTV